MTNERPPHERLEYAHRQHSSLAERQARGFKLNDLQQRVLTRTEALIAWLKHEGVTVRASSHKARTHCANGQVLRIDEASRDDSTPMDAPWRVEAILAGGAESGAHWTLTLSDDQAHEIAAAGSTPATRDADPEDLAHAMIGQVVAIRTVTRPIFDGKAQETADVFEAPRWNPPGQLTPHAAMGESDANREGRATETRSQAAHRTPAQSTGPAF